MRWLRLCLTGFLFFYPLLWLSVSLIDLLPKLFSLVLRGYKLDRLDLHFWMMRIAILPPEHAPHPARGSWAYALRNEGVTLAVLLLVIVFLVRTKHSQHLFAGLGVTFLGWVALLSPTLSSVFGRRWTSQRALFALFFFGAMCIGLRWIAKDSSPGGFFYRLAAPLTIFGLPAACFSLALALASEEAPWRPLAFVLATIVCGALLACTIPFRPTEPAAAPLTWTPAVSGLLATLVLAGTIYAGGQALDRKHASEARAMLDALPPIPADLPFEKLFFQKGVSFTAEYPAVYGSQASLEMLKQLPAYGVNSIALVPYGSGSSKEPRIQRWDNGWERDDGIRQLSRMAHSLGMKVMLKPQLWVRPGNPMDLDFPRPQDRAKWFVAYAEFLEHYTRLATEIHADVLCIGVEFEKMSAYETDWRGLIARTRQLYPGELTYAANFGREFESVSFWDALDYIGLDEYYPLPDDLSTQDVLRRVEAVQKKFSRPVLFTEAGFPSVEGANRKPWDDPQAKLDPDLQARTYDAVFRTFYDKPWFKGMYWWKVGTNGSGGLEDPSHTPWRKPAMEVVRRWYTGPVREHAD
jgi:hypothetical protein